MTTIQELEDQDSGDYNDYFQVFSYHSLSISNGH